MRVAGYFVSTERIQGSGVPSDLPVYSWSDAYYASPKNQSIKVSTKNYPGGFEKQN